MKSYLNTIFIIFLLGISLKALSQNNFQKTFGGANNDVAVDLEQTVDNGILLLGYTNNFGSGGYDIILAKLNPDGTIIWSKLYGESGDDFAHDINRVSNGDYIISGHTKSTSFGEDDIYILRIDLNGNLIWSTTFGGNSWEQPRGKAIETSNGDLIILSTTLSFGAGAKDIHFLKIDSSGELLISRTFGEGSDNDWVHDYIQLSNGNILIAGRLDHNSNGSFGGLICIDEFGELIWSKSYNSTGFCKFYRLIESNDGNIIAVGRIDSYGAGGTDVYVVKVSPDGNLIWAKTYGGSSYELANGVEITSDQKIIVSGYTGSFGNGDMDIFLMKINNDGNFMWGKTYGGIGEDYIYCGSDLLNYNNTAYFINGKTKSFGAGNNDMYLIKTDTSGISGCNESNFTPIVTSPPINVAPIQIYSGSGGNQGVPNTITIDFTLPDSVLCSNGHLPISSFYAIDTILCNGDCIEFIDSSMFAPSSWNWYFEGGSPSYSTSQNPTNICYFLPGDYDVKLIVSNQYGSDSLVLNDYITILSTTEVNLGNDTLICEGDELLLNAGNGYVAYLWNDGTTNQYFYANQSGSYWVQIIDDNSCLDYDTINLYFILPDPDIGSDTAICSGDSITFYTSDGFVNYLWHNGSEQISLTTGEEGLVWCEVIDTNGCLGSDSLKLDILLPPYVSLGNDTAFCVGDSLWLLASQLGNEGDIYWQDGSDDTTMLVWEEGEYWVIASNVCGSSSDTVLVSVKELPWVYIGNDTILAMNTQIELDAGYGFEEYFWCDGCQTQSITISEGGSYWVNVFDGQCYNTDTIFIEPIECELFIPIVFTPNWDGSNDYFYAETSKDIIDFDLTVFNRWGEKVWETQDKDGKWDGQNGASKADEGTYFWVLNYKCLASPILYEKKGSVTLLR